MRSVIMEDLGSKQSLLLLTRKAALALRSSVAALLSVAASAAEASLLKTARHGKRETVT